MKKTFIFALVVFMIALLSGCDDDTPPNEVHSPEDTAGRVIGALSGSPSARLAGELGVAHPYDYADEMISHLRSGVIDCVIMERMSAEEILESSSGIRILSESLLEYDFSFAVARENNQLLSAVDSALEALTENGVLVGLRGKYFAGRNYMYSPLGDFSDNTRFLTLAVSPDSAPFSFINADGEYDGFNIEVARAVCDYLEVELRIMSTEVARLIPAVQEGSAHLAVGWLPDDMGDFVNVSETFADIAHVVLVRR